MKYLPLFTLGLLISFIFFFFPATVKAESCANFPEGGVCIYETVDNNGCQLQCNNGQCQTTSPGQKECKPNIENSPNCSVISCPTPITTPITTPIVTISPKPVVNSPPSQTSGIYIGVQLAKATTIGRLLPSQYSFQWVKFQYSLGSDQPIEQWINYAKQQSSGGGKTYQVLVSIAKNDSGILPLLKNPIYPEQTKGHYTYTQKYCPWDDDLDEYQEGTGNFEPCGTDEFGTPKSCEITQTYTAPARTGNGYIEFRDAMQALAPKLTGAAAVEIWNEPNIEDEWTKQGLGPVSAENYVNFMNCGIKGLKKGGYNKGTIISAGLAPRAYASELVGPSNVNDITFFDQFISNHGLDYIDAIGWHANVTSDIPPTIRASDSRNDDGFQRVRNATGKGKPVWITEFGWDRSAFQKGNDSEKRQLQAKYIAQAYEVVKKDIHDIKGMFVWNFGWAIDYPVQTAFAPWDIEGGLPQGLLCQPNPPRSENAPRNRTDTTHVQDVKTVTYPSLIDLANKGLLPEVVVKDVDQKTKDIVDGTKVDVTKSFLSELLNLLPLQNFLCSALSMLGIDNGTFCTPILSIGKAESTVQGKNTKEFAMKAEVLGKANIPVGMTLIPEVKDCNIGKLSNDPDPGDENLNTISKNLGNNAGYFAYNIPKFKEIAASEWNNLMETRMKTENLNTGTKLFQQDKRDPEECLDLKNKITGSFPSVVLPPNMTCDDVYNLILLINRSRYL